MSLVLTLVSHPATMKIDEAVLSLISKILKRPIDVTWLNKGIACDIPVRQEENEQVQIIKAALYQQQIDTALQHPDKRRKKILIADMDSTMIEQECIDELADAIGIKDKVANITEQAMRGEIAFEPALRERVALLKGLPIKKISDVIEKRITLRSGGRELVQTMKANGGYTALVSGGFTSFTTHIANKLGFDENRANTLLKTGDKLSGEVKEPILGAMAKVEALEDIVAKKELTKEDVMAIGDGANDLDMIKLAGSGIAIHAKPKVAKEAQIALHHSDLTALLYLQGYKIEEFKT